MAAAAGAAAGAGAGAPPAPDPLIGVRRVLDTCNFEPVIRDRFIALHGIAELGDFEFFPFENAKDVVKMYNEAQRQQGHKIGYTNRMRFKSLLW